MNIQLTPSFVLTSEHPKSHFGVPVLLHRVDGAVYGPADLLEPYRSHGEATAAHFVHGIVKTLTLDDPQREAVAKYLRQWPEGPQL